MDRKARPWSFPKFLGRLCLVTTGLGVVGYGLMGAAFKGVHLHNKGFPTSFQHGLKFGVAFGVASGLVLGIVNYFPVQLTAKRYGCRADYNPWQSRSMVVNLSVNKALAVIEAGLMSLPWILPETVTTGGSSVRAVTQMTFRSLSEDISVCGTAEDRERTVLIVASKPHSTGTMVDYGKGIQNVEELTRAIHKWVGPSANAA